MSLRTNDEFTLSVPPPGDEDGEELALAPLDPVVVENRRQAVLAELPPPPVLPPPGEPWKPQFTTRGILLLMTAISVALAILRLLPADVVAGVVAGVALLAVPIFHSLPGAMRKIWWSIFGAYLLACLVAFFQM